MIHSDTVKPEDDDELSDEEEDMNDTDEEETKEKAAAHDPSFLTALMESFMEKVSFLKSREGRAGLVHNFLRGLQLMTAPVPNGEILTVLAFSIFASVRDGSRIKIYEFTGLLFTFFITSSLVQSSDHVKQSCPS